MRIEGLLGDPHPARMGPGDGDPGKRAEVGELLGWVRELPWSASRALTWSRSTRLATLGGIPGLAGAGQAHR